MHNYIIASCPFCDKNYILYIDKITGKAENLICSRKIDNVTHDCEVSFHILKVYDSIYLKLDISDFYIESNFIPVIYEEDTKPRDLLVENFVSIFYKDREFVADNLNFKIIKNSPESFLNILKYYFNTTNPNFDDLNNILSDPENLKNLSIFL